jgi:hypothetical protein
MAHNIMATKFSPPVIVAVRLKKTSTEVIRASTEPLGGGKKEEMTVVTRKSIKNAVEVLTNADPELNCMLVATYPETYPDDGRIVKAHHKGLLEAMRRKFGDFSYFTAIEYQSRGAPHLHVGLSIELSKLGEVVSLKRKKSGRRYPAFQTVQSLQDWAFETWLGIIGKPDISYNGEALEWDGIDEEDVEAMHKAYYHYNSGFSWEVMRSQDGAKRYFVKELTGLKLYQKTIPQNYTRPGRHFLYSEDMRFDKEKNGLTFIVNEGQLRGLLKNAGWKFIPDEGKPLFKYLWNSAAELAVALIEAGFEPIESTIKALRQYADLRMTQFVQKGDDLRQWLERVALIYGNSRSEMHWERFKEAFRRQLIYEAQWRYIFNTGPP